MIAYGRWIPFLGALGLFVASWLGLPLPDLRGSGQDFSLAIRDRWGHPLRVYLNQDQQWILPPAPEAPIPDKMKTALQSFEDKGFEGHWGFSLPALLRAFVQNISAGRIESGGSTLTMQAARLAFPRPRHLWAKIEEILISLKMELFYSKSQILRLYLDLAPFGGNIRGYRAASWKYFGKEAQDLTWAEAALLAVLPNAPGLMTPGRNAQKLKEKRDRLLSKLFSTDQAEPAATLSISINEPLPEHVRAFPFLAPHAADFLRKKGYKGDIGTTIDGIQQTRVEEIAKAWSQRLEPLGIGNLAVLAAETATGAVRAYTGSQDFWGERGQIDAVQAPRSTGSLLKPFLYGLGFDRGLLRPQSLLKDIPLQFGSFSPQNADRTFHGLVSARQALIRSLNIPAVDLLNSYGIPDFLDFLKRAGLSHLFRSPAHYGLPLILGGAEASVWEIASLYRSLGKSGEIAPISLTAERQEPGTGSRLLSPAAAWEVMEILKELRRPGIQSFWKRLSGHAPLAWKTGTSYGQKDGWAAGVSPEWTIVVWIGNVDGTGNANLSSIEGAAPLLLDIFEALNPAAPWFPSPDQAFEPVGLCSQTGFQAGPDCPSVLPGRMPRGALMKICPYHETIYTTLDGKWRVSADCWKEGEYKKVAALRFPADVEDYLRVHGQPLPDYPPWSETCSGSDGTGQSLLITAPDEGARLWLPRDLDGTVQLLTARAVHHEDDIHLFWYLDGRYLGNTQGRHTKELPGISPGQHRLLVIDGHGNRKERSFEIKGLRSAESDG